MKRVMLIKQNAGPDDKGEIFPSITAAAIWLGAKTGEKPEALIKRLSVYSASGSPLLGYFIDEPLLDEDNFLDRSVSFEVEERAWKIYERREKAGFPYKSKATQEFVQELQRALWEKR